ncbi:putative CRISPR-associated protein [Deferrisoma camini]|uniref:putative CRISPR-associated protein n=1 Tax=Deferrisoma camini TaxID=1035120 RepID=UPI00046D5B8E|nr:putative CRISPR-associated protein [Deferrisoma camini]
MREPLHTILCTVGTSLVGHITPAAGRPSALPDVAEAWSEGDFEAVARRVAALGPDDRRTGAELQSLYDLVARGHARPDARIELFHSATPDGRAAARVVAEVLRRRGHPVELHEVEHLQDADPKRFRSKGLRVLVKLLCRAVRAWGTAGTGIDATGGYKAQIAVAVVIGQALGVPVFYRHERFPEVISFPPLPVSLDYGLWMRWSGVLAALDRGEWVRWLDVADDWEPVMETMVERVALEESEFLDLSAMGQVFHEAFRHRFRSEADRLLPPPATQKSQPRLTDHAWGGARTRIGALLARVVDDTPYVTSCRTHYWNPDLPSACLFRLRGEGIEGVWSDGTWTVKFWVDTTAVTPGQREACVADLNARVAQWR